MGVDFHHIMESKKSYEPSRCAARSPREAMLELRKTRPQCKLCHAKVTHPNFSLTKFLSHFNDLGYKINETTGYVVKEEESKKRHYDLVDTDDEDE